MKFELKTENQNYSKSFLHIFMTVAVLAIIISFCDALLKLGIISRHYQIEYNCSYLSIKKTKSTFKKISKLTNLKSKQRILEFCKEFVK